VTADGYVVQPGITVPQNTTAITVNNSGEIIAQVAGQQQPQNVGQLQLAEFPNEAGLEALGQNLMRETEASGAPAPGVPGTNAIGTLLQGFLETSNVNVVSEITNLITAQRAYEMNSKVVQAANEMSQTLNNIR
jgi:flagellar basal-body rod protein FlgG